MSRVLEASFSVASEGALENLGANFARLLEKGDQILLEGNLGCGKTCFARAVIQTLCGVVNVPSPTFTLVQTYRAHDFDIWHADFYRLKSEKELDALGFFDHADQTIRLIEWPSKIDASYFPEDALHIRFDFLEKNPLARHLRFFSKRGNKKFKKLVATC